MTDRQQSGSPLMRFCEVVMKKAKYFITCHELASTYSTPIIGINELRPERLRPLLLSKAQQKKAAEEQQLSLDFQEE